MNTKIILTSWAAIAALTLSRIHASFQQGGSENHTTSNIPFIYIYDQETNDYSHWNNLESSAVHHIKPIPSINSNNNHSLLRRPTSKPKIPNFFQKNKHLNQQRKEYQNSIQNQPFQFSLFNNITGPQALKKPYNNYHNNNPSVPIKEEHNSNSFDLSTMPTFQIEPHILGQGLSDTEITQKKQKVKYKRKQKKFFCQEVDCNASYVYESGLQYHINTKHKNPKSYQCKFCNKTLKNAQNLNYHLTSHTKTRHFQCNLCHKKLKNERTFKQHMILHQRAFPCEFCPDHKTFTSEDKLLIHLSGHHLLECNICKKSFKKRQNLEVHMRSHTGEKPFVCKLCNKRFTVKASLKTHIKRHKGEKLFSCSLCNKEFITKGNCKRHEKTCPVKRKK